MAAKKDKGKPKGTKNDKSKNEAPQKPMSSKDILKPYHSSIAAWRGEGASFRDIAQRLHTSAALEVDFNAIRRYCEEFNLRPEPRKKLPAVPAPAPKKPSQRPTAIEIAEQHEPPKEEPPAVIPHISDLQQQRMFDPLQAPRSADKTVEAAPSAPAPDAPEAPKEPERLVEPSREQAGDRTPARTPDRTPLTPTPAATSDEALSQREHPVSECSPDLKPQMTLADLQQILDASADRFKACTGNAAALAETIFSVASRLEEACKNMPATMVPLYRQAIIELKAMGEEQRAFAKAEAEARTASVADANADRSQADAPSSSGPPALPVLGPGETDALYEPLPVHDAWTPDLTMVAFGEKDQLTLADVCEGVAIFGSTGSGKTSGSGQALALSYLVSGFGGLVLSAKSGEADIWKRYADATDRTGQLCVISPGGPFKFNFLDYQSSLPPEAGGSTENIVELLMSVIKAYVNDHGRSAADPFWENASSQLFRNWVRLYRATRQRLSLDTLRKIVLAVPRSLRDMHSKDFRPDPYYADMMGKLKGALQEEPGNTELLQTQQFWRHEFPDLNSRTRSIVSTHLTSMIDLFFEPQVWDLFCTETTITPNDAFQGAVLVVDTPIANNAAMGRLSAIIFKHLFQLAVVRRGEKPGPSRRPVFLWVDEAQNFTTNHDSIYQAIARDCSACTVYLTQNISNYYAQAGGDKNRVDGFFSNLNTKIFHANNDPQTNQWAAEMIGRSTKFSSSVTHNHETPSPFFSFKNLLKPKQHSVSTSERIDYTIQPAEFSKLRTGGYPPGRPEDTLLVDAVVFKSGARFSNGKNFFKTTFQQR